MMSSTHYGGAEHPLGLHSDFPPILYKYRSWNQEEHRQILKSNMIFFASPADFNDPFDCKIPWEYEHAPKGKMNKFLKQYRRDQNPDMPSHEINRRVARFLIQNKHKDPEILDRVRKLQIDRIASVVGVFSLTASPDNLVMWSHYGDAHKGFCVGFDTEKFLTLSKVEYPFGVLKTYLTRVTYVDEYPYVDPFDADKRRKVLTTLTFKSSHWSYENEYRFIVFEQTNTLVPLPDDFIVEVRLGCRMGEDGSTDHKSQIIHQLKSKRTRVRLLQAVRKEKEFGLDFVEEKY